MMQRCARKTDTQITILSDDLDDRKCWNNIISINISDLELVAVYNRKSHHVNSSVFLSQRCTCVLAQLSSPGQYSSGGGSEQAGYVRRLSSVPRRCIGVGFPSAQADLGPLSVDLDVCFSRTKAATTPRNFGSCVLISPNSQLSARRLGNDSAYVYSLAGLVIGINIILFSDVINHFCLHVAHHCK